MTRRRAVVFTSAARADVNEIARYLIDHASRETSKRWIARLTRRARSLANAPYACMLDPDLGEGRRRAVVAPYLIIYSVHEDRRVSILRVVHGSRDLKRLFAPETV